MHLPFSSLITLPVPILLLLSSGLLLSLISPLPWCVLLLSVRSAAEEAVIPHLASPHPVHTSFYRLCLAVAILVTIPPTMKRPQNRWFVFCFLALGFLLSLAATPPTKAENFSPAIRGTVSNPEGSCFKGARVVVTNQTTETVYRMRTTGNGSYEFRNLPVGTYSLRVQFPGFQTFTVYGIDLTFDSDYTRQIDMIHGNMTRAILFQRKLHQRTPRLSACSRRRNLNRSQLCSRPS